MTTATARVLDELDALIAERSILQHPFYRAWTAGALTPEDLAVYARVYYPHVAAFPSYLQAAMTSEAPASVHETLAENLRDELSVPAAHRDLWLRFADAVGADAAAVRAATATPGAAKTTATFARLCDSGAARGVAALYAYESQQPAVSLEKLAGLRAFYGISNEEALAYFTVHAETDIAHRAGERRALDACLQAGATREDILDAASQSLDAYWHLLDAVCAERGGAVPVF